MDPRKHCGDIDCKECNGGKMKGKRYRRLKALIKVYNVTDDGYRFDQANGKFSKREVETKIWLDSLKKEMRKELGLKK